MLPSSTQSTTFPCFCSADVPLAKPESEGPTARIRCSECGSDFGFVETAEGLVITDVCPSQKALDLEKEMLLGYPDEREELPLRELA